MTAAERALTDRLATALYVTATVLHEQHAPLPEPRRDESGRLLATATHHANIDALAACAQASACAEAGRLLDAHREAYR